MTVATIARPETGEYFEYYERYINRVPPGGALETLTRQIELTLRLLSPLSDAEALKRYAPGKWSVKEVVGHMTDAERVFCYRALRFARADRTELPGFDENAYVPAASFDARPLAALLEEFADVRRATVSLYRGLDEKALRRAGVASGHDVSVRALAYIIAGHEIHHVEVLKDRYGIRG
jgi:uncharacterized damage-inducible protein DinB